MSIRITKQETGNELISRVKEMSGVDIGLCLQCKKCSSGCPVGDFTESSPSEVIRLLQLGAGKELLDSSLVWTCASCETCYTRCPMKIDMASVMDALRVLANELGAAKPEGNAPLLNSMLLKTVKSFGRTYDLGIMALYKMGTSTYLKDTGKFPTILKKGKIALLPPRGADKKITKQIFKKVKEKR
ncbi:MAG: heterodisulfide reductase [bacterium]|nr:heterodisulfide reductase [bacterium]